MGPQHWGERDAACIGTTPRPPTQGGSGRGASISSARAMGSRGWIQTKKETKAAPFIEKLARPRPAAEGFYILRREAVVPMWCVVVCFRL
jgi:hypothetical protein